MGPGFDAVLVCLKDGAGVKNVFIQIKKMGFPGYGNPIFFTSAMD
jgi:hypothetical protein